MSLKLAEAYIKINVDTSGVAKKLTDVRNALSGVSINVPKQGILSQMMGFAGGMGIANLATSMFSSIASGASSVVSAMIDGNSEMERYKTQFQVFLGSEEAAAARFKELFQYAADTPFEMAGVAKASLLLQNFAGSAAATGSTLRMVGDMASASGTSMEDVAFWTGRMIALIKAGQPFGEAAMRLQELGLMSGETRSKMEEMTKAGANGNDIWAVFVKSQDKVKGMTEKLSKTFGGLASTLRDEVAISISTIGAPLFDMAKGGIGKILEMIKSPDGKAAIATLSNYMGGFVESISSFVKESNLVQLSISGFKTLGSVLGAIVAVTSIAPLGILPTVIRTVGNLLSPFMTAIQLVSSGIATLAGWAGYLFDAFEPLISAMTEIVVVAGAVFGGFMLLEYVAVVLIPVVATAIGGMLITALLTLKGVVIGLSTALMSLWANPVGAIVLAVAAVAGFGYWLLKVTGIGKFLGQVIMAVFSQWGSVISWGIAMIRMFAVVTKAVAYNIATWFKENFGVVVSLFGWMWDVSSGFIYGLGKGFMDIGNFIISIFTGVGSFIGATLAGIHAAAMAITNLENPLTAFNRAFEEAMNPSKKKAGGEDAKFNENGQELGIDKAFNRGRMIGLADIRADLKAGGDVAVAGDTAKGEEKLDLSGNAKQKAKGKGSEGGGFMGIAEMSRSIQGGLFKSAADKNSERTANGVTELVKINKEQLAVAKGAKPAESGPSVATFGG